VIGVTWAMTSGLGYNTLKSRVKKQLSSMHGSSLITVLIAAGLGAAVALGMASFLTNMQLSVNNTKYRTDADSLTEEVRSVLSSPAACLNTLGAVTVNPSVPGTLFPVTMIRDGTATPGQPVYNVGGAFGDNSVRLEAINLGEYVPGDAATRATMTLALEASSVRKSMGATSVRRAVRIAIETDPAYRITSCIALARMSDGIWQKSQANLENIFFTGAPTGGRVGIGTSDPRQGLDVIASDSSPNAGIRIMNRSSTAARWPGLDVVNYSGGFGGHPNLIFNAARGSATAPQAVNQGDVLGSLIARGHNGVNFASTVDGSPATIGFIAAADFSATSSPASIVFSTIAPGISSQSRKMIITADGDVGVGTMAPSERLHVVGNARIEGAGADCTLGDGTGGTNCTSDERLKINIAPIGGALDKISRLSGVDFDWRHSGRHGIGVIAQQIQREFPSMVITNADGYLAVDYGALTAPLIEATKELDRRCRGSEVELAALKAEVAELKRLLGSRTAEYRQ